MADQVRGIETPNPVLDTVLILGCGYAGSRVASRLLRRGLTVHVTATRPEELARLAARGARPHRLDVREPGQVESLAALARTLSQPLAVLHSVPLVEEDAVEVDPTPRLVAALAGRPARLVYLSTTSVYGTTVAVDESTPPAPRRERERLRVAAEQAAAAGPWTTLVLRPAAIYGPGRGAHVAVRTGRYRSVGAGSHVLSRIHVDDLAALVEAALSSHVTGAYPVADDQPAASAEVAAFVAGLLGHAPTNPRPSADRIGASHVPRHVDGRAIRRLLGVTLQYPGYREGIPAAIAAEEQAGPLPESP
ncbi:MAG: NAD-dependent epimerase/dehydratase family protein [Deltaproteobacteria bacterium]|nr:NAD-dependent epimerase/dehydratase family protein [Deltaproteobacteria bacterium]